MNSRLYNVVIAVVLCVWVMNFLARFVIEDYQPAPQIDAIFMAIAGGAMALNQKNRNGGTR